MNVVNPDIRSIPQVRTAGKMAEKLMKSARFCADDESEVVAYAMVALHANGHTSSALHCDFVGKGWPMNTEMFLAMVALRLQATSDK